MAIGMDLGQATVAVREEHAHEVSDTYFPRSSFRSYSSSNLDIALAASSGPRQGTYY